MTKLAITTVTPGDVLYLSLRYFDGNNRMWYDGLELPDSSKLYVVQVVVDRFAERNHRRIVVKCDTFADTYTLNHYDVYAHCSPEPLDQAQKILVTESMRAALPRVFM